MKHFCYVILKLVQWFLTRSFLKFSIQIYWENKPCPLAARFLDESRWLEQSFKLGPNWPSGLGGDVSCCKKTDI